MWQRYLKRQSLLERAEAHRFQGTPFLIAMMLWVCTLPLLAFLAAPFLGWKATAYLAGFLLVADLVICWFICRVRIPRGPIICTKCLKRLNAQARIPRPPRSQYQEVVVVR